MQAFLSTEDKIRISTKIREVYDKFKKIYPEQLKDWERPGWHTKLTGTTAGLAYLQQNKMAFNAALFLRNREDMLNQTVPHEVAHLVAFRVFGDKGHGDGWKRAMRAIGLVPERCHSYDVTEVKRKVTVTRFYYRCSCRDYYLSSAMHEKLIKNPRQRMQCCHCGAYLMNQNEKRTIQK